MQARPWHSHYDAGVPASLDYESVSLPEALVRSAREHPGATAIVFAKMRWSYAQLLQQVERCAGGLAGLGVGPGSRVAIQLPNLPQAVVTYYATLSLGGQVVMTNPLYTDAELEHQWTDSEASVAVVADHLWIDRIPRLAGRVPIEHWVVATIPEVFGWPVRWLARRKLAAMDPPRVADLSDVPGTIGFRELLSSAAPRPMAAAPALDEVAVLQYTGGTTGASKGAMLTHRNLSCNVQQLDAWYGRVPRAAEVFLAALPYFHVFGMTVCMNHPLWTANTIVLQPDPRDIGTMLAAIARHRVSILALVPAMFHGINEHPEAASLDLSSVKACLSGSAPLPPDTLRRFEALTGGRIFEGYGLTETSPVACANPLRGERKVGSIGLPVSDTDARIVAVDDASRELPPGEEGELLISGPQVMAGYWKRPDETAKTLQDGWLLTGDLAVADEAGYLRIVGRKKEMILTGGYNVYPDEIDRILTDHPAVLEAATIGVPDDRLGETVKSFVVVREGEALDEAAVIAWCRERLAAYKAPRAVEFRADLPRSSVMKVLRRELLAEELERRKKSG